MRRRQRATISLSNSVLRQRVVAPSRGTRLREQRRRTTAAAADVPSPTSLSKSGRRTRRRRRSVAAGQAETSATTPKSSTVGRRVSPRRKAQRKSGKSSGPASKPSTQRSVRTRAARKGKARGGKAQEDRDAAWQPDPFWEPEVDELQDEVVAVPESVKATPKKKKKSTKKGSKKTGGAKKKKFFDVFDVDGEAYEPKQFVQLSIPGKAYSVGEIMGIWSRTRGAKVPSHLTLRVFYTGEELSNLTGRAQERISVDPKELISSEVRKAISLADIRTHGIRSVSIRYSQDIIDWTSFRDEDGAYYYQKFYSRERGELRDPMVACAQLAGAADAAMRTARNKAILVTQRKALTRTRQTKKSAAAPASKNAVTPLSRNSRASSVSSVDSDAQTGPPVARGRPQVRRSILFDTDDEDDQDEKAASRALAVMGALPRRTSPRKRTLRRIKKIQRASSKRPREDDDDGNQEGANQEGANQEGANQDSGIIDPPLTTRAASAKRQKLLSQDNDDEPQDNRHQQDIGKDVTIAVPASITASMTVDASAQKEKNAGGDRSKDSATCIVM